MPHMIAARELKLLQTGNDFAPSSLGRWATMIPPTPDDPAFALGQAGDGGSNANQRFHRRSHRVQRPYAETSDTFRTRELPLMNTPTRRSFRCRPGLPVRVTIILLGSRRLPRARGVGWRSLPARGWTGGVLHGDDPVCSFSASAGVVPLAAAATTAASQSRLPRESGGGPPLDTTTTRGQTCSPLVRGWTVLIAGEPVQATAFPAPAGVDRRLIGHRDAESPRQRGWAVEVKCKVSLQSAFPAAAFAGVSRCNSCTVLTQVEFPVSAGVVQTMAAHQPPGMPYPIRHLASSIRALCVMTVGRHVPSAGGSGLVGACRMVKAVRERNLPRAGRDAAGALAGRWMTATPMSLDDRG